MTTTDEFTTGSEPALVLRCSIPSVWRNRDSDIVRLVLIPSFACAFIVFLIGFLWRMGEFVTLQRAFLIFAGGVLVVLAIRHWSISWNKLSIHDDHLALAYTLRRCAKPEKCIQLYFSDVKRLYFVDRHLVVDTHDGTRLRCVVPSRLLGEDMFELLADRVRKANPSCAVCDPMPQIEPRRSSR